MSRFFRDQGVADGYTTHSRRSASDATHDVERAWREKSLNTLAPDVCTECNNNVLSELENDYAKPILTRLCLGEQSRLPIEDQVALAAWITRFAMVAELLRGSLKSHPPFLTPLDRRQFIDALEPPADAWIWLASLDSQMVAGTSAGQLLFKDRSRAFIVTGTAGRLVFQFYLRRWTSNRPPDDAIAVWMTPVLTRWANATVQLSPNIWSQLEWPPKIYLGNRGLTEFNNRWGGASRGRVASRPRFPRD
jgi:hypothetical protein